MKLYKEQSEIHLFHFLRTSILSRLIVGVVLTAFLGLITQPTVAAVRADVQRMQEERARAPGKDRQLADALREVRDTVQQAAAGARQGRDIAEERRQLAEQRTRLRGLDQEARAEFDATAALLAVRQVPEVIQERHREAVASYRKEMEAVLDELTEVERARTPDERKARLEMAEQRLTAHKMERAPHPFDPTEPLPHAAQQPRPDNLPRERREDFLSSGLHDTPLIRLAALEGYRFDGLPDATEPAYLADSDEVTLSEAIQAQAAALERDPVAIYHWVRNHIEWLPTWGAVQNAELTLSAKRGNSHDIASLLIALLRASGVPARYVHGTIDVPEDKFRNWAGGFQGIEAAANYAASGGIPITGVIEGGRVAKVRMEHIWVEAAIDYAPSRGAVNRSADTWLPLDASYKQYEFTEGLDVAQIANLDGEALANSFLQSGAVNEQEGWVQNLDASLLQNAQTAAQQKLEAHITQLTDPTVGEVIGGRKVIIREQPVLPSGLPYQKVVEGARYGELPAKLRPTITFGLGADLFGDPHYKKTLPWPHLNNRKVTLSFKPATADDEAALKALLPEGEITDISQLPQSIPAYLIQVIPEVKVDGETILAGSPMRLGEDLAFSYSVSDPIFGTQRYPNQVVAGSFLAVGVIGGSVGVGSLEEVKARLNETKDKLQSEDAALIAGLTRENLLGDMFHAGLLGYFAQYQVLGHLSALSQKNHFQLATSAGTYGYVPNVNYYFGIPRSITPGGVEMDLDRVAMVSSVDGKGDEQWKNFNFQLGALSSALEHAIPEQMFVTEENPGEAVSAVKALQKAAQQGQRIYHITQANQATALPNIRQNSLTMNEIRSALAVGKEVIVHTDPISVPGWTGAGYVITDPQTGAGAWKIGGGGNGGEYGDVEVAESIFSITAALMADLGHDLSKILGKFLSHLGKAFDIAAIWDACDGFVEVAGALYYYALTSAVFAALTSALLNPLSAMSLFWIVTFIVIFTLIMSFVVDWIVNECRRY